MSEIKVAADAAREALAMARDALRAIIDACPHGTVEFRRQFSREESRCVECGAIVHSMEWSEPMGPDVVRIEKRK